MAETFVNLPVIESHDETHTLRSILLDGSAVDTHHTSPGQVIKIKNEAGEGYFALANAPRAGRLEILVRRGGAAGDRLIAHAIPGEEVHATAPFGRGFPVAEAHGKNMLLFAAGSGISPTRALIQHVLNARDKFGQVILFYGERTDHDFAFADDRHHWAQKGVQVVLCSSRPSENWAGPKGYVQDVARAILADLASTVDGAVAYLCGMKGMVSSVRDTLAAAGLPAERTFLNY